MTGSTKPTTHTSGPIAWMARNPVAANLAMALLLLGGIWAAITAQKEVFPQFELDIGRVSVGYPGAAPEEVEQGILRPVEEAIRGIEGIREITSEAREGNGSISVELVTGADRMKVFQDIDQAVTRIRTFPDDIDQPDVTLQSRQREVMSLSLYGPVDIWTLRQLAETLRDQLLAHEQITQVELGRVPDYITHVEVPRERLREYGFTLPDIARLIEDSSEDIAAGAVQTSAGEVLLRVKARKQWAEQFAAIQVVASRDGAVVTLGDIATIRDGFEEGNFHSQFNRQPSVDIEVYRVGNQSPGDVAAAVESTLRDVEAGFPPGVSWRIDNNNAEDFQRRLALVTENGLLAIAIVLLILAIFLELRLAFWVMMGMAISFIGGVLFLPSAGVSINMVSLFGFLIVLGIVVDDAVVVGENVYEYRQEGLAPIDAAIKGAREMAGPVTFSILTNIVAFVPLMFIPGETGKFWRPLPIVVIIVLAVSLLEALFILPAHLAHIRQNTHRRGLRAWLHRGQRRFAEGFAWLVNIFYRPALRVALQFRYVTIATALALLGVVASYSLSAHMGLILMPEVSADEIEAGVRLPVGTTPDQAARVAELVTAASTRMFEEHNLDRVAEGLKTNVRGGYRPDVSVDLSHSDIDTLEAASAYLVAELETLANTRDVSDNYNRGKAQLDFELRPEGRALGLTPNDVGEQLRGAFFGSLDLSPVSSPESM